MSPEQLEDIARLVRHDLLAEEGIAVRVIDLYSVKPVDRDTLRRAAEETRALVTVEDHYAEGGLGEAQSLQELAEKHDGLSAHRLDVTASEEIRALCCHD